MQISILVAAVCLAMGQMGHANVYLQYPAAFPYYLIYPGSPVNLEIHSPVFKSPRDPITENEKGKKLLLNQIKSII